MPFSYEEAAELVKSPEKLKLELDDDHLIIIAMVLNNWKHMAPALNLRSNINEIDSTFPNQEKRG